MNESQNRTTVPRREVESSDNPKDFHFDLYSKAPLTEAQIFERVVAEIVRRHRLVVDKEQLNQYVQSRIADGDMMKGGGLDWSGTGPVPLQEWTKGTVVVRTGYAINVTSDVQQDVIAFATSVKEARDESQKKDVRAQNPVAAGSKEVDEDPLGKGSASGNRKGQNSSDGTDYNSDEYRKGVADLEKKAAEIQLKFEAIDAFYQGKNQRHGLGGYYNEYLSNAADDVTRLQDARNEFKLRSAQSEQAGQGGVSALGLAEVVGRADRRLREFPGDASKMTPEEITQALNKAYDSQFETLNQTAEWIGMIPTPVTRGAEFGLKLLGNTLKYSSGDIDTSQFALEIVKDGSKFVVGNYAGKGALNNVGVDGTGQKILTGLADFSENVVKEMVDARASLIKDPSQQPGQVYQAAIMRGFVGGAAKTFGDSISLVEKYAGGAEGVKNFASSFIKEGVAEYTEVGKQLAKTPGADASQLYKEAAARSLIKATASAFGTSYESFAGDDEAVKFLYKAALKLGVDEQVKGYLERQKSVSEPATPKGQAPSPDQKSNMRSQSILPTVVGPSSGSLLTGIRASLPGRTDDEYQTLANALRQNGLENGVSLEGKEPRIGMARNGALVANVGEGLNASIDPDQTLRTRSLQQSESDLQAAISRNEEISRDVSKIQVMA